MATTPIPDAPRLLPGEDTGASDSDGIIKIPGPLLVGQTLPGATIALYDNAIATGVANTTADANGFYTIYPYPILDDGKNSLTITATAPGEDTSAYSLPLFIVVDTAAPDPPTAPMLAAGFDTGSSAEDGITSKRVLQLTGVAEPDSMVALYNGVETSDAPAQYLTQVMAGADGSYTLTTATLPDGVYTFTVKALDLAGNLGKASAATSITVDGTAPPPPATPRLSAGTDNGVSHTDGLTNDPEPVVTGTAEANATVNVYDNGLLVGTGQADANGNYAITAKTIGEGGQALTVKAVDAAGNTSAASGTLNIVIDTAPATAAITAAAVVEEAGSVTFTVTFSAIVNTVTATDFAIVTTGSVTGSVQSVSGSGSSYTVTVTGLGGDGTVALKLGGAGITDLAGNAVTLASTEAHAVSGTNTPSTSLVSASASGVAAMGELGSPSASGRIVAFDSTAGSLVPSGAVDGTDNIFVKDTQTGALVLVSVGLNGAAANGDSFGASLSGDGTTIAFASDATNLVEGGTTTGVTNIYVAHLTEGPSGPALVPNSIELVSEGNGQQGEGPSDVNTAVNGAVPLLSKDGSTVVFDSDQELVGAADSTFYNVYSENIATGVITLVSGGTGTNEYGYTQVTDPDDGITFNKLTPEGNDKPGGGGDFDSFVNSVSDDGQLVGYQSDATDLGGTPIDPGSIGPPTRSYVYDQATGATTNIDGTATLDPSATVDTLTYQTFYPELSGNGSTVFFEVNQYVDGSYHVQSLYEENLATKVITPIFVPGPVTGGSIYVDDVTSSRGGGLVLYQNNPGVFSTVDGYTVTLANPATGTMTALPAGYDPILTTSGDAYTFVEAPDGAASAELYETNFGISAGIDSIGTDDAVGASALTTAAAGGGLAVSGTTNAPAGSTVSVQIYGASPTTNTLNSPAVRGTADGAGHWTATVPTALLQAADGQYAVVLQIGTPAGSSFFSVRDFVVDTKPPATPDAPKLDAGSDTSTAGDGSATNQDTPILTGTAEAGSTVTLYDTSSATPETPIGTAVADSTGVYVITATALINGKHRFDVTATDPAGNVSDASGPVTVTIDTIVPDAPIAHLDAASDTGISQSDGITSNATPDVVGTAEAGTTVTLYDTDTVAMLGTATVAANGKYRISASSLTDGAHTLTVTDTDAAGNVSPASAPIAVTIDTLPPFRPTITSVTGALVSGRVPPLVTVDGVAEPNSLVTLQVDGGTFVLGMTTAASDGEYSIDSDPLPPGDGQNLSVTDYDAAANASQSSLPVDINVSDSSVAPPGTPPFTPTLLAQLTDGPIAGATVFADANGDGVRDAGEASAVTDTAGDFTLYGPSGNLEATGGTDTTTGLALPGSLFAPAGSTVIDPLTTLLFGYEAQTGADATTANAAVATALGLLEGSATDLTTLNPNVASGTAAIVDAKLADLAADVAAALSHDPMVGKSAAVLFDDVFQIVAAAIVALPAGATLDLDSPVTLLSIVETAAGLGAPTGAQLAVDEAVEQIMAAGNAQLDTVASTETGAVLLTGIAGVETVEQGAAANALARIGNDPDLTTSLVPQYTGAPLIAAASVTASLIIGAPRLVSGSDTGLSDADTITDDLTPTVVGTALPGTFVTLVELTGTYGLQGQVLGSVQADTSGHYQITSAPLAATSGLYFDGTPLEIAAVGSTTNQNLAVGAIINVSAATQPQGIELEAPIAHATGNDPLILDASPEVTTGNDAGHSGLLVQLSVPLGGTVQVFADGGTTPIGTGVSLYTAATLTLSTAPLSLGVHTLTVTESLDGGTQLTSDQSYSVTVTAPASVQGTATAIGPVAGGSIIEIDKGPPANDLAGVAVDAIRSVTQADGAYTATISATSGRALTVSAGYDTITGLPLGGYLGADNDLMRFYNPGAANTGVEPALTAPYDDTAISPLTSIVADLNEDAAGIENPGTIANTAFVLNAFGLNHALDLTSLDPLKQAQTGDPAPLLAIIKLLDTVTVLSPLNGYTFEPIALALDGEAGFDLNNAASISTIIADGYVKPQIGPSAAQLAEIATIVAAGNAAIDAHAKIATSLADTLSYAFAAERLEQNEVLGALNLADDQIYSASTDVYAGLVAADTGAALDAEIQQERGQSAQVTSLVPVGSSTTAAARVTFAITFGEAVTGLAASAFQLVTTGLQGAAITGVAARAGTGGTTYDIAVSTGVGQGTVALTYDGGSVLSAVGKPLTTGVFAPAVTYVRPSAYGGGNPHGQEIAVGDFNGDGRPDAVLVASANSIDPVTVFLNTGEGGFQAAPSLSTETSGDTPLDPIAVDVDNDGKTDLLIAEYDSATVEGLPGPTYGNAITALLGNGDGTFQQPINTPLGFAPSDMVAGDFNGDGNIDVALSNYQSNTLQIMLGNGAGGFTPLTSVATGQDPGDIVTTDFNGDGKLDLAVSNRGDGTTTVLLGNGDGTFTAAPTIAFASEFAAFAAGDLNGDGIPDLVIGGNPADPADITVLLGKGDGTFTAIAPFIPDPNTTAGNDPRSIVIGDVNNDGIPDLVIAEDNPTAYVAVMLGNGDGTFRLGSEDNNGGGDPALVLADVDGDGRTDILTPGEVDAPDTAAIPGLDVLLNEPETVVGSASPAITIDRPAVAQPDLSKISGVGTLTQTASGYTLDLGSLPQGAVVNIGLSLANLATGSADSFDGLFSTTSGSGYKLSGATLPTAIVAGSSYAGLALAADTSTLGGHTETLTFAPRDVTNDPAIVDTLSPDATNDEPVTVTSPAANVGGTDVALELAPITLTISDDVTLDGEPVAPMITGTLAAQPVTDEAAIDPFAAVLITDLNPNQTETVTVTQNVAADGTLSDPKAAADDGVAAGANYAVSGTAAQVSAALKGLVFTPTAHQVPPGQAVKTGFTIAVSDTAGLTASDATTSVVATAVDDTPVIGGTRSGLTASVGQTLPLFSLATITDPDVGAVVAVTITSLASGAATDADGLVSGAGLTRTGIGSYVLSAATPAAEQALLRSLIFMPAAGSAGSSVTTTFSVVASDGTKSATDAVTTVTVTTPASSQPGGGTTPTPPLSSSSQPGSSTPYTSTPVYRFFDTVFGTHLFTQSRSEAENILASRPDLTEETNNFGAVNPQTSPAAEAVYRFFEAGNGTHFLTANYQEFLGLTTPGTSTYRSDMTYEPNSTFYEDSTQQAGDVAVYQFFDTVHGTQFLTSNQSEFAGLTTAGLSTYRPDLKPEGITFYAPAGTFSA